VCCAIEKRVGVYFAVLYSREENVCVLHNRKEIVPVMNSREEYACAVG
jgi:hypothetical protein